MTPDQPPGADDHEERQPVGALTELPRGFRPGPRSSPSSIFRERRRRSCSTATPTTTCALGDGDGSRYGALAEFLAEQLFGRWSLVLHYDLGRGLRVLAGRDEQRLKEMVTLANRKLGDLSALAKDPAATFALLDRFVRTNIMAPEADRLSLAFILDQASYVFPSGEPGRLSAQASSQLVTMLNWATSPHVKRLNMAFVLIDEKLADLSERLTGNPHVAAIEVPLPDEAGTRAVRQRRRSTPRRWRAFSDFDAASSRR